MHNISVCTISSDIRTTHAIGKFTIHTMRPIYPVIRYLRWLAIRGRLIIGISAWEVLAGNSVIELNLNVLLRQIVIRRYIYILHTLIL